MQIETLNTDLDELDITDTDEVINFGSINRPDVIINLSLIHIWANGYSVRNGIHRRFR